MAIFRIFQEALTNVARHSGAKKVDSALNRDKEGLRLILRDNGRGISEEEISRTKSLGLVGMRERALVFGGELIIQGKPGKGPAVTLKIPRLEKNPHRPLGWLPPMAGRAAGAKKQGLPKGPPNTASGPVTSTVSKIRPRNGNL